MLGGAWVSSIAGRRGVRKSAAAMHELRSNNAKAVVPPPPRSCQVVPPPPRSCQEAATAITHGKHEKEEKDVAAQSMADVHHKKTSRGNFAAISSSAGEGNMFFMDRLLSTCLRCAGPGPGPTYNCISVCSHACHAVMSRSINDYKHLVGPSPGLTAAVSKALE